MKQEAGGQNHGGTLLTQELMVSHLSYIPHKHLQDGTTHSGLGPRASISTQENDPETCLQSDIQESLVSVRLAKTK